MKNLAILSLVAIGMISGVLLVTRGLQIGNLPNINYFDNYANIMPGRPLNRLPYRCSVQDAYGSSSEDTSYYCVNPDSRVRYISINEHNGIINYVTFGTHDLLYGDLIAIFGQPTRIRRSRNGSVVSVYFGNTYALVIDRSTPLSYTSRVANLAFGE